MFRFLLSLSVNLPSAIYQDIKLLLNRQADVASSTERERDFKILRKIHFLSEIRRKPGNTVSFLSKSDVYYIISNANRGHIADVAIQQ